MPIDRTAAETFIWSAARLVDRHRYAMLFAEGSADPVLAALSGYRNLDGGFGHALEPDLRCPGSQPAATLQALEILHEAGRLDSEMARGAAAWIARSPRRKAASRRRCSEASSATRTPRGGRRAPNSMLTFAIAGGAPRGSGHAATTGSSVQPAGAGGDRRCHRAGAATGSNSPARSSTPFPTIAVRAPRSDRWAPRSTRGLRTGGRHRGRTAPPARHLTPTRDAGAASCSPMPTSPHTSTGGSRTAGRRRLDVRLARLVARADVRVARDRHDPRADMATGQRPFGLGERPALPGLRRQRKHGSRIPVRRRVVFLERRIDLRDLTA